MSLKWPPFPPMREGMKVQLDFLGTTYVGTVKRVNKSDWYFVANNSNFPGHDCNGLAPKNNGYYLNGWGNTDNAKNVRPVSFNELE